MSSLSQYEPRSGGLLGPIAVILVLLLLAAVGALTYALFQARGDLAQATEVIITRNKQIEAEFSNVQQVQGERDELEATVESLEAERDGLEATVESLEGERNGLKATVESLETERNGLNAAVEALRAERGGLEATFESLQDERGGLEASYSVLSDENSGLRATLQALEAEKTSLETQVEEFKLAHGSVTQLEERAEGLRAVIAGLEEDRMALQVSSSEMFPTCTGSMEPGITCLDTVVVLTNFRPEDIAVDTVIAFYPPEQTEAGDGPPVLHRVTDIKIEEGVHYFWPRGDALDEPDGHWISKDNVLGYVIELQQGTRPENTALRERVNGAREQYVSARGKMLEARDKYDDTLIRHCGSVAAASSCATSQENLAEIRAAYDTFTEAWDEYLNAVCEYDKAYYHGTHESEPLTGQMFDPYVAPSACSQGG
ncbi:MAG: hypothetical protein OXE50_12015 [Chloroflexi bacterium]|nr:hypothetical protein [Chloroflexota bacterium]